MCCCQREEALGESFCSRRVKVARVTPKRTALGLLDFGAPRVMGRDEGVLCTLKIGWYRVNYAPRRSG